MTGAEAANISSATSSSDTIPNPTRPFPERSGSGSRTGNAFCIQHNILTMAGAHECLAKAVFIKCQCSFYLFFSGQKSNSNGEAG